MTRKKDRKITQRLFSICTCIVLMANQSSAQLHTPYLPQNAQLFHAEELFMQQQYKSAEITAKHFLQQTPEITSPEFSSRKDKARYFIAASALKLNEANNEQTAIDFINTTANPAYKQRVAFALAQEYFKKNRFSDAIYYYEMAGVANLNNDEIINAKFELAYCYFNNSQFNQAEPLLASVREIGGKYYDAGNYYYGLLAYNKNNYADALTSFSRIEHIKEYSNIVPYYIAEIHYFQGNKAKALQDALRLIRKPERSFYHNELHLLAAQIYFEDKDYKEALPYFEFYYDNTERIRKEDLYEMAYCYYKLDDWEDAIDNFQQLSETRDSLAQSSMYLLGDCYLKINDKKSARNAFSICADMPFNPGQKEASLLLAAKLSYELGYNNDAIYYINLLLADYPTSAYNDQAKTLLSDLLIRTSNYAEAYSALEDVAHHDENYNRIYQKVTYGYAMQQMQLGNNAFADSLLTMSLKHNADLTYKNAATYWKADLAYKAGRYDEVIKFGNSFLRGNTNSMWVEHLSPSASARSMYITLGYAAMELSQFSEAQNYFNKARFNTDTTDTVFIAASILREADAVFMQKDYKKAIALYDQVIAANGADADYARYQKAIILGLSEKKKKKSVVEKQDI
ncbi:MAG: tetratricopeptide repeat protein [Chitinophagaceae bacterium]|nr:tetratricopeptide repeat protein [Chitinophagaceae bacterium]